MPQERLSTMPVDISIVQWLQENRPDDLLRILDGDPRYVRGEVTNEPYSREQVTIYKMAYDHVWFLDRFGQVEFANEDGVLYSQHPEYFKHWLDIGCPGVDEASIQHYLKLKPIKSAK